MLITKFDLYETKWLDLVFADRNKGYGAYELRRHYGSNMLKAMGITFLGLTALIAGSIIFAGPIPIPAFPDERVTPIDLTKFVQPPKTEEAIVLPATKADAKPAGPASEITAKTTAIPTVISNSENAIDPPVTVDLKSAIGSENKDGDENANNVNPGGGTESKGTGTDGGDGTGEGESNKAFITVEVMPEPVGGAKAWGKFIQKNLKFPAIAQENGVSGRVFLSFIIEKDGRLTDFKVLSGAGAGFDEEALRVLKLS
ncbi:MAG: TonB family protein, partial [Sphingobacteriaceae bacterium]